MPEVFTPSVRIHRVTTRRRTLRVLNCPLEPELLVAEFAGELPPEVTIAVREHIAVCETCGARSQALRTPYELLASLGDEPVPFVPDLRDAVRLRIHSGRFYKDLLRAALTLGRGGAIGMTSLIGVVVVAVLLVSGIVFTVNAHGVSRSSNGLTHVLAAGSSGTLFAETDKLVTVTDSAGHPWQVAEVIAVDQRTGAVSRSLPASGQGLQAAHAGELPVATQVSSDGSTVYEVTAVGAGRAQALVAFDAKSGKVMFVARLALPGAQTLPADNAADGLALTADGSTAYIGLNTSEPTLSGPRTLAVDARSGAIERVLTPDLAYVVPMPPPPGSLPISAFPKSVPQLDTSGLRTTLGAGGSLVASPDGAWLFDLVLLWSGQTPQYGVVRRINAYTGVTAQALALPGDFRLATLAISQPPTTSLPQPAANSTPAAAGAPAPASQSAAPPSVPQLYVVKGSPDAQCYVLDPGVTGPTLVGDIGLGGPASTYAAAFTGTVIASPSVDGTRLFVGQNAAAEGGRITGNDLWVVDTQSMAIVTHRFDVQSSGAILANASAGGQSPTFALSGGAIILLAPNLSGGASSWLNLDDGHAVIQLLASQP
jgi:hypothetical protein